MRRTLYPRRDGVARVPGGIQVIGRSSPGGALRKGRKRDLALHKVPLHIGERSQPLDWAYPGL